MHIRVIVSLRDEGVCEAVDGTYQGLEREGIRRVRRFVDVGWGGVSSEVDGGVSVGCGLGRSMEADVGVQSIGIIWRECVPWKNGEDSGGMRDWPEI